MKGKQNFILGRVTVILIITCDTKRKEGRKKGDKFRSENDERDIYISAFFSSLSAHDLAYLWRNLRCAFP